MDKYRYAGILRLRDSQLRLSSFRDRAYTLSRTFELTLHFKSTSSDRSFETTPRWRRYFSFFSTPSSFKCTFPDK